MNFIGYDVIKLKYEEVEASLLKVQLINQGLSNVFTILIRYVYKNIKCEIFFLT